MLYRIIVKHYLGVNNLHISTSPIKFQITGYDQYIQWQRTKYMWLYFQVNLTSYLGMNLQYHACKRTRHFAYHDDENS